MRLLTADQFEKEPLGTVYCQWKPDVFIGDLCIKEDFRGEPFGKSWYALDLLPWHGDMLGCTSAFIGMDEDIPTGSFCTADATYNYDKDVVYAVFNTEEVKGMIDRLSNALKQLTEKESVS